MESKDLIGSGAGRGLRDQFETRQFSRRIRTSRFVRQRKEATRKTADQPNDQRSEGKFLGAMQHDLQFRKMFQINSFIG